MRRLYIFKFDSKLAYRGDQVHPILNASWTIVSWLYEAVQETDLHDDSIRELASTLREMLATAKMIPDLPVMNTTDIIVDISRQSLRVGSIIHEYTKLSLAGDSLLYSVKHSNLMTVFYIQHEPPKSSAAI